MAEGERRAKSWAAEFPALFCGLRPLSITPTSAWADAGSSAPVRSSFGRAECYIGYL